MSRLKEYFLYQFRHAFRKSSVFNYDVAYLCCFFVSLWSMFAKVYFIVGLGFVGFFITALTKDYRSGNWLGKLRKDYANKTYEMQLEEKDKRIASLEAELERLKKSLNSSTN